MKHATQSFKMFYEPLDESLLDYFSEMNRKSTSML